MNRIRMVTVLSRNTVYKWEGSDYRWPRENLACLSEPKKFCVFLETTKIFFGTNGSDPSRYNI